MDCCTRNCASGRCCSARKPAPRSSLDQSNFTRLYRFFRRCGHGRLRCLWLAFDAAFLPYQNSPKKGTK